MYKVIYVSNIAISISRITDIEGYTISELERTLLSDEEMEKMNDEEIDKWIRNNNAMMENICQYLNDY
jgi:predicted DNA-binding ArsR family transcriptional regulator